MNEHNMKFFVKKTIKEAAQNPENNFTKRQHLPNNKNSQQFL